MCGIAGIVAEDKHFPIEDKQIRRMCAEIVYRGPDDEGVLTQDGVGIGMRRLSIIDIATGKQPICNEDGSVWIVFNGEIYNFPELRTELESLGHIFRTNSDTEAIVHAYESYGSSCVSKLRGMFAFAVYDFRNRTLFLARDRFGKKPLHYALRDGVLYFGSEIKSILAVAPQLSEVSDEGLSNFFFYSYIPDPLTAFSAIRKLPPGHCLLFENGSVTMSKYWDVPKFNTLTISEADCMEMMEQTLREAVRMRLISDVPLGALLSGGVDSSLVVAMMAKISRKPVKTFSIGFTKEDFNEAKYARSVATRFETDHHELIVEADVWNTLEHLSKIMDEPFGDSSVIPTYHVSKMARRHVTVVLSGDGGDELFAGYEGYLVQHNRRHLDLIPNWVAPVYHKFLYPLLPARIRSRKLFYNFALGPRDRFIHGRATIPYHDTELTLLSDDYVHAISTYEPPEAIARAYYDNALASDGVSRMQYTDLKLYLTADVLTKVDRMSMACSLEVRCPLLDHVFAELAVQLPRPMKLKNRTHKYLLRRLAEKLGVPREALYRPKKGFALPLTHWMRDELRTELAALLLEPRTIQRGYFRKSAIEAMLKEHQEGDRDHSSVLWQLLVFELWHRNYLEPRTIPCSSTETVPLA